MSNKYGVLVLNLHLEFEINMIKLIKQATHIALGLVFINSWSGTTCKFIEYQYSNLFL